MAKFYLFWTINWILNEVGVYNLKRNFLKIRKIRNNRYLINSKDKLDCETWEKSLNPNSAVNLNIFLAWCAAFPVPLLKIQEFYEIFLPNFLHKPTFFGANVFSLLYHQLSLIKLFENTVYISQFIFIIILARISPKLSFNSSCLCKFPPPIMKYLFNAN